MTFRVVLTGGIASGKSAAANEFVALGVPVIDTDQLSRDVVAPGSETLRKIVAAFGPHVLDASGQLNRGVLRERVFSNPDDRKKLESITHPAIGLELERRSHAVSGPYQIHAIPLYVENGARGGYDRVLVIDTPVEMQLARLTSRDGSSESQARNILAAQASRDQRIAAADDVILNDGSLDELREQVDALHVRYLALAAAKSGR